MLVRNPEEVEREWTRIEKVTEEIEELRQSLREMLRNIISIFGVFVAIFSFIIISMNTTLRIEFTRGFWDTFWQTASIILPIILGLILLLGFARFIYKYRSKSMNNYSQEPQKQRRREVLSESRT